MICPSPTLLSGCGLSRSGPGCPQGIQETTSSFEAAEVSNLPDRSFGGRVVKSRRRVQNVANTECDLMCGVGIPGFCARGSSRNALGTEDAFKRTAQTRQGGRLKFNRKFATRFDAATPGAVKKIQSGRSRAIAVLNPQPNTRGARVAPGRSGRSSVRSFVERADSQFFHSSLW
jgi:hypothetical protein